MENVAVRKRKPATKRLSCNIKKKPCVVFKECRNVNCLCECEGCICREEPYDHCNIIETNVATKLNK